MAGFFFGVSPIRNAGKNNVDELNGPLCKARSRERYARIIAMEMMRA